MRFLPLPCWTVTFPTRPAGLYSKRVRAVEAVDAVRVAATLDWRTAEGYEVAFDWVPEVWRIQRPFQLRSRHVQGPRYPEDVEALAAMLDTPATVLGEDGGA